MVSKQKPDQPCARPGCQNIAAKTKKKTIYCSLNCFNKHKIQKKNNLITPNVTPGIKYIPLTQGKWALVDENDFEEVSKHNWCAIKIKTKKGPIYYAKRPDNGQYMHSFILGMNSGSKLECIHGPGGTLDNTRNNLRIGSRRENQRDRNSSGSTSKYKGVSWNSRANKWAVNIMAGNEYYFLGYFRDEREAALAYDMRARELHGEFARFNFPGPGEISCIESFVIKVCSHCGKNFEGPKNLQYCSLSCVYRANIIKRPCLECGIKIQGHRKFCSHDCRKIYSDKCDLIPPPPAIEGASWIKLTLGKYCLVDNEDLALITHGGHKWFAKEGNGNWYACRGSTKDEVNLYGTCIRMHRFLEHLTKGDNRDVGHLDGNSLNNRRSNLYLTNNSNSHKNAAVRGLSGYKGVIQLPNETFRAHVFANGQYKYLGVFQTAEEAARAYDEQARKLHGFNGRYNFPLAGERSAI
jgi:hypothetical protein